MMSKRKNNIEVYILRFSPTPVSAQPTHQSPPPPVDNLLRLFLMSLSSVSLRRYKQT